MKKNILLLIILFLVGGTVGPAPAVEAPPPVDAERSNSAAPLPNGGRSPAWSPDGTMIAFLSSTLHTPADLWVMKAGGAEVRRLTTRGVQSFRWAADGRSLDFVARRKGYEEAMTIGSDGRGEKRLPGLPPGASLPHYSPDGKLYAFTAQDEKSVRNLWIATADGTRSDAVTMNISVRGIFWSPDSRKLYYEAGKTYGVGIWEIDLATMESKALLNKYIGTPVFSPAAGLIAYAYPTSPGVFEVQTMKPDGSDTRHYKAPRLDGRWLSWDAPGKAVYYLGQDIRKLTAKEKAAAVKQKKAAAAKKKEQGASPHEAATAGDFRKVGVTALWRLDLETGKEKRISPLNLHLSDFDLASGGEKALLTGVLEQSHGPEIFNLDLATGESTLLAGTRPSQWMPVPSPDATKIAFFTNEGRLEALKKVSYRGEELAVYPGLVLEGDTRVFWLPESEGLLLFSGRGVYAFSDKGEIEFPNRKDHRTYLYADASLQADKVLLSAIPRYGETPGLYLLTRAEKRFVQADLRFPSAPERAAELYVQPRWSLDGKKIAFTDQIDIWTMKADGTARVRITDYARKNEEGKEKPALASFPVWSVAGDRLCYTLTIYDGKTILRQLWLLNADGTEGRMLFSEELDSQFQVFQPEYTNLPFFDQGDKRIIFTAAQAGVPEIFALDTKDGALHPLTEQGAIYPALLPEEGVIVYTSLAGNDERLWVMNSDGTEKRPFEVKAKPAMPKKKAPAKKTPPVKKRR